MEPVVKCDSATVGLLHVVLNRLQTGNCHTETFDLACIVSRLVSNIYVRHVCYEM
jgi:hypothetical protein